MNLGYLARQFRDAGAVELRHAIGNRVDCGLFADMGMLMRAAEVRSGAGNLFTSLNRPAATPTNRMGRRGLRDEQITHIVRLPFDFDPDRPSGTSATADELAAAVTQRDRFVNAMLSSGWPMPALAVSGNGAHAVFRCCLPNDRRTRDAVRTIYRAMRAEFGTERVLFDSSVHNPSRVWRLYGTTNRKGTPTADRPHRVAEVVLPHDWREVTVDQVHALAAIYGQQPEIRTDHGHGAVHGVGDYTTLDVPSWFGAHGLYRRPLGDGKHAVRCPWDRDHSTRDSDTSTSTVMWDGSGNWPTFHCSHAHCEVRNIRDVMTLLGDADRYCARAFNQKGSAI